MAYGFQTHRGRSFAPYCLNFYVCVLHFQVFTAFLFLCNSFFSLFVHIPLLDRRLCNLISKLMFTFSIFFFFLELSKEILLNVWELEIKLTAKAAKHLYLIMSLIIYNFLKHSHELSCWLSKFSFC